MGKERHAERCPLYLRFLEVLKENGVKIIVTPEKES